MNSKVRYDTRQGVALVSVNNPPVNALTQPVRAGLLHAIETAGTDPEIGAIVIAGEGRTFPAGVDVRDVQSAVEAPTLGDVCAAIEACPKPVVAAIHGTALGGGLELALACHFRLAEAETQLGLPDVALGLVPAAGATQRLPRIVGARAALDMLISGRPITAENAARLGLVEKVCQHNTLRAALGSARNLVDAGIKPRRTSGRREGFHDPAGYLEAVQARRVELAEDPREAVICAIDLVEAALLLPFDEGLAKERVSFEDLVGSDQARGLRHAFLSERRTARVAELAGVKPRRIKALGVVGNGPQAAGIVQACLAAGLRVTLLEQTEAALAQGRARIEAGLAREVEQRRIGPARYDAMLARLTTSLAPDTLVKADLVIESVAEDGDEKTTAIAWIGGVTHPGTVLASTSWEVDLDSLSTASGRPADVLGLRFFAPSPSCKLVEVRAGTRAATDLLATGVRLARRLGKVPVLPGTPNGSVAIPVFAALIGAADYLVGQGATRDDVDAALVGYGFERGPYRLLEDREPDAVSALRGAIQASASSGAEPGPAPRTLTPDEISARCVLAMTNAGAGLVASGIARKPSDVDAAMLLGFGFPQWRGGPMEAADLAGLLNVRNQLAGFAEQGEKGQPDLWTPAPLFDALIKNGRRFADLNADPHQNEG